MKALILNSGIGKRMGAITENHPKCMTEIGDGYTIISRQLELLHRAGIESAVITTGPFEEALKEYVLPLFPNTVFVHNPRYSETNYIYSIHLAENLLDDDIVLLHGDLVLDESVLRDLVSTESSSVAVEHDAPLPEKDFKARLSADETVSEIGVSVFGDDCVMCQPAYKLTRQDMRLWLDAIAEFCSAKDTGVYAENALNTITDKLVLRPLALNGRLCHEIDNLEDLEKVSRLFLESRKVEE